MLVSMMLTMRVMLIEVHLARLGDERDARRVWHNGLLLKRDATGVILVVECTTVQLEQDDGGHHAIIVRLGGVAETSSREQAVCTTIDSTLFLTSSSPPVSM